MLAFSHMRIAHQIVFASMNVDKYREMKALLSRFPDVDLVPPEGLLRNPEKIGLVENHATYLENAAAKARLVNQGCHYPALADDSGLEIAALGGKPGVHSHRYAKLAGYPSRIDQDQANIQLALSETKGRSNREARFVTSLALVIEGILVHATGTLEGSLAEAPRGKNGFGYDSIFVPKGETRTLAEMTETEKNALSHRARALDDLFAQLQSRGVTFARP